MALKIRTMVISSDPAMLGFLEKNLSTSDCPIESTQNTGEELRLLLDTENPDLIIVDIMMPDFDGVEVCLRIRQWSDAPIIMLSAWGSGGDKVRALDMGADCFLTEPFGIDGLRELINEALQRESAAMDIFPIIHSHNGLEI